MATAEKQASDREVIRYHLPIFIGINMLLCELFESKPKKQVVKAPPPRNFVAKNAKTSGAGSHTDKKHNRKEKHKNRERHDSDFQ